MIECAVRTCKSPPYNLHMRKRMWSWRTVRKVAYLNDRAEIFATKEVFFHRVTRRHFACKFWRRSIILQQTIMVERESAGKQQSRLITNTPQTRMREARPDEINYALVQNMGEGFSRREIRISALGTSINMVYGEWIVEGKSDVNSPVVLCIHGTPATDGAFRPIGSLISARGYRVLTVNFPGSGYTERVVGGHYNCSVPHKKELVKALIFALGLKSVTMVICHSLGSHVATSVATDRDLKSVVQSVCYICGTAVMPHRLYRNFVAWISPFMGLVYRAMYLPFLGPSIIAVLSAQTQALGFRGRTPEANAVCWYEISLMNFNKFREEMLETAKREQPVLLMYALDDPLVEPELLDKNIEVLGIPDKDIKEYDQNDQSNRVFSNDTLRRVVRFANGTHRIQYRQPQKCADEIVSLLDAIIQRNKSYSSNSVPDQLTADPSEAETDVNATGKGTSSKL